MPVSVDIAGGTARIVLTGDLDYSTRGEIQHAIQQVLEAERIAAIVVDLAAVTFLDSSAIGALLTLQQSATRQGQSLVLADCSHAIRDVFSIGGFDKVFTFR
jgi:anti-anti-sigma factor